VDPLLALAAEFWWIGPAVVGAGALGWAGVRHQRTERARRLAYDTAKHELRASRTAAAAARAEVKVARAELARLEAERAAARATGAEVTEARRRLRQAERDAKASAATVRSRRAHVGAARAALPASATDAAALPLARLLAAHDAVDARWLAYETDPAKLIAFPTMSDGRSPATAAFLAARTAARELRPASATARLTPPDFAAYRDAVHQLEHAFAAAEKDAYRRAGVADPAAGGHEPEALTTRWTIAAHEVITRSAESLTRATEAAATAFEARVTRGGPRPPGNPRPPGDPAPTAHPAKARDAGTPQPAAGSEAPHPAKARDAAASQPAAGSGAPQRAAGPAAPPPAAGPGTPADHRPPAAPASTPAAGGDAAAGASATPEAPPRKQPPVWPIPSRTDRPRS